jgi:hypothetical protein
MIEEFRLSLFAQELRTLGPVSAKRLEEQLRGARRVRWGHSPFPAAGKGECPHTIYFCLSKNGRIRSIGSGNTMVVAFSLDRSASVCR